MLRLSGVTHVVGGPDVLHGRVLAALLGPEERVLQRPARAAREAPAMPTASPAVAAAPTPAAPANVPATSPAVGARAAAPSARPRPRPRRQRRPHPPPQPRPPSPQRPAPRHAPPPARAVEAVRPECLHLLLRNFARRPFHAPALGARVAQLGT